MKQEDIIYVMKQAGHPVTPKQILDLLKANNRDYPKGKTPQQTIAAKLYTSLKKLGDKSPYCKSHPTKMLFTVNPNYCETATSISTAAKSIINKNEATYYSFTTCAEEILKQEPNNAPLHYREITRRAIEQGLLSTQGKTPEASMYAQILSENKRRKARAERPRFICYGQGMIGLVVHGDDSLEEQIEKKNHETKQELLKQIRHMEPKKFEELVTLVFAKMGFKEMVTTQFNKDGGVDVRGILEVDGVININLAIQVKRISQNVQRQVVDALRGCLSAGERGVIVTSSDFSKAAQETARDKTKNCFIDLINGEAFVNLMVEHEVGVKRNEYQILYLRDLDTQDEN